MIYMREHYGHLTMQQFQMTVLSAKDNAGAAASSSTPASSASSAAGQKRSQTSINSFLPRQAPPAAAPPAAAPPAAAAAAAATAIDDDDDDEIDELLHTTADPFHVADGRFQGPPRDIDGATPDGGGHHGQRCRMHTNDTIAGGSGGSGGGGDY